MLLPVEGKMKQIKHTRKARAVDVSIIVPAYNEERRMRPFLTDFMKTVAKIPSCEVLFVDDGSRDQTAAIFRTFARRAKNVNVISLKKNAGKGGAVIRGVFAAKGKKIIFIDIDGSIAPHEILAMIPLLNEYDVVVGSRAKKESIVKQSLVRKMTSSLFNPYVNLLFQNHIGDHLCGFKGFKRAVARDLFGNIMDKRWLFDVEIFYHIRRKGYTLYELPITWINNDHSKMSVIEPFRMGFKLIFLRLKIRKS